MADPQRLVDDPDASPLARSLLASADGDAPSSRDRAAVAKRLGIAAGLLAASGEVGAGSLAGAMWWKIGLLVVAIGGAITGGVALTREPAPAQAAAASPAPSPAAAAEPAAPPPAVPSAEAPPAAAAPASPATAPAPAAPAPAPAAEPAPAAKPSARSSARSTTPPPPAAPTAPAAPAAAPAAPEPAPAAAAPADPAPAPAAAAPPPAPTVDARRLAAEVAILDRARAALRGGDPGAATAALDEHARDFADGALVAEAELVRIETLIRAGDAEAARRRARDFLVRFPQSPLAKRLRSLVDRIPAPAPVPASDSVKESP